MTLANGERLRPIAITLLDPAISLLIVGPIFVRLVTLNVLHLVIAVVGGLVGLVVGYARARVMFVRAVRDLRSVVLQRHGLEYALVVMLVVVRSLEQQVSRDHSNGLSLLYAGLVALGVVEAIARTAFLYERYRTHDPLEPTAMPEA